MEKKLFIGLVTLFISLSTVAQNVQWAYKFMEFSSQKI